MRDTTAAQCGAVRRSARRCARLVVAPGGVADVDGPPLEKARAEGGADAEGPGTLGGGGGVGGRIRRRRRSGRCFGVWWGWCASSER